MKSMTKKETLSEKERGKKILELVNLSGWKFNTTHTNSYWHQETSIHINSDLHTERMKIINVSVGVGYSPLRLSGDPLLYSLFIRPSGFLSPEFRFPIAAVLLGLMGARVPASRASHHDLQHSIKPSFLSQISYCILFYRTMKFLSERERKKCLRQDWQVSYRTC